MATSVMRICECVFYWRKTECQMPDKVTNTLQGRILHCADESQSVCCLQNLIADCAALSAVAVEEMFVTASAGHQRQLPGQIKCILHSGVHALPAGRTVHVRRVAEQEDAARTIVGNFAAIDPEAREPDRIKGFQPSRPSAVDDCLHLFQRRFGSDSLPP